MIKTKSLYQSLCQATFNLHPSEVLKMIRCGDQSCASGRCRCVRAQLACTIFCDCYKSGDCQNKWTKITADLSEDEDKENEEL